MKCIISRSTCGVILGAFNIFVCIYVSTIVIFDLVAINAATKAAKAKNYELAENYNYDDSSYNLWEDYANNEEPQESINEAVVAIGTTVFITILVVCLTMAIISGLLIVGIVKRRHQLMAPWLVVSTIGVVSSVIRTVMVVSQATATGIGMGQIIFFFVLKSVTLCVSAYILYTIFTLYKDIRNKNKTAHTVQIVIAEKVGFKKTVYPVIENDYTVLPQKV